MGRLGPLTAQALGRSPYDDVVYGEGEDDPRAPAQLYDSRGRPVNPETKRIHRDMIRSHNEVMQVIGVAEPENSNAATEAESQRQHHEYEEEVGSMLLRVGRALEIGGVWGVNGLRQRILLYKEYSHVRFFELYRYERQHRSLSSFFLTGLPTYLAGHVMKYVTYNYYPSTTQRKNTWLNGAFLYVRVHMQLYVTLQRLDILPASQWFPSPSFFIPCSATSPIPAPPPPKDFSAGSLLQWFGRLCINAAPMVAFVVWGRIWTRVTTRLWKELNSRLPNTAHRRKELPPPRPATPEPILTAEIDPEQIPEILRQIEDIISAEPDMSQLQSPLPENQQPALHPPVPPPAPPGESTPSPGPASTVAPVPPAPSTARRPSAFSARGGDDYASDEEEHETVSATLISFDVEATESLDAPPGLWSAELRPSLGPEARLAASQQPLYLDTMLTRLPAFMAADIFSVVFAYVTVAPYEAVALRLVARAFRRRMGLGVDDILEPNLLAGLTWRAVANFLGLEFTHLMLVGEVWAAITCASYLLHITEEEWRDEVMERRNLRNERERTEAS